jgi:hypothetical protein
MSGNKETPEWCVTNVINSTPFSVTFSFNNERITVQLDNGEDVLKLGNIFSDFLTNNGIPNTVTKEL